jgi:hypothetical protein
MKIIFLDVDGVLNSDSFAYGFDPETHKRRGYGGHFKESATPTIENVIWDIKCINALKRIVETTGALIVISSTWRVFFSVEKFCEMFALYGWEKAPIIGKTDDLGKEKPYSRALRGLEVNKWLASRILADEIGQFDFPLVEKYAIIDDYSQFLPEQYEFFVQTDPEVGLTEEDADIAIKILNNE